MREEDLTSAGGSAVTDATGGFELAVDLPPDAESVRSQRCTRTARAGGVSGTKGIARWDGQSWSPLGSGLGSTVFDLLVFDDGTGGGSALYAGGSFIADVGGASALGVARWDGQSWSALGSGISGWVWNLAVFDDGSGSGPALFAGGTFTLAGGSSANNIAKWDGQGWSALGSGLNDLVRALAVFDDGTGGGPALYAAGDFTLAGGVPASHIAKWDGQSWSPVGGGTDDLIGGLAVFDDGSGAGPALYAGGPFTTAGGASVSTFAKWDGQTWSDLESDAASADALFVLEDVAGDGPWLYARVTLTSPGQRLLSGPLGLPVADHPQAWLLRQPGSAHSGLRHGSDRRHALLVAVLEPVCDRPRAALLRARGRQPRGMRLVRAEHRRAPARAGSPAGARGLGSAQLGQRRIRAARA